MNNQNEMVISDSEEIVSGLPVGYEQQSSLAVSLARAEIDQQIVTARAMPRSIARAVQNITTLATLDDASAEECIYALPRAGKAIKGPSIRLAEIIASQWGNCRVGARVVHVDRFEKFVEAEGVFHDLETNTATTSRVRRRISNKHGALLQEDMIVVTGNAACAIAKRNAIFGAVPKAVWRKAYEAVEGVVAGDIKTLVERRDKAIAAFAAFGVTPEQLFASLGVVGVDDIGLDHLSTLTASRSALKSGESTVEEMFPPIRKAGEGGAPKSSSEIVDKLAGGGASDTPAHDPKTGEIKERRARRGRPPKADKGAESASPAEQTQDAPDEQRATAGQGPAETPPTAASPASHAPAQQPAPAAAAAPANPNAGRPMDWWLAEGDDAAAHGSQIFEVFLRSATPPTPFRESTLARWRKNVAAQDEQMANEEGAFDD